MLQAGRWKAPQSSAAAAQAVSPSTTFQPARSTKPQAKQLFARFGVPCARERDRDTPAEAEGAARELGGRVVLKILSGEITHKSEVGGVAVNLTPEQVGAAPDGDGRRGRSQGRRAAEALPRAGDGVAAAPS